MAGDRRNMADGFTLIELLVVLAVLAAIAAIVVPSLSHALPRSALGAATAEVRAVLRTTASLAVAEGRTIVFRSEPAAGYWLDNVYHRLGAASDQPARLSLAAGAGGGISFYSWGGSSGGRIWVENAAGRRAIDVDAVSGRAVVAP